MHAVTVTSTFLHVTRAKAGTVPAAFFFPTLSHTKCGTHAAWSGAQASGAMPLLHCR